MCIFSLRSATLTPNLSLSLLPTPNYYSIRAALQIGTPSRSQEVLKTEAIYLFLFDLILLTLRSGFALLCRALLPHRVSLSLSLFISVISMLVVYDFLGMLIFFRSLLTKLLT